MLLAGKLVEKMTDKSVRTAFESALLKIKSVLNDSEKDHLENLYDHIEVFRTPRDESSFPDHFLTDIQKAVVDKEILRLEYFSSYSEEFTKRDVEPIGLFYYSMAWHLIAWCKLRNGYRDFRADRIKTLKPTGQHFDPRNLISLKEYLATVVQGNQEVEKVMVLFDKTVVRYVGNSKYGYGFISEEEVDSKIRMTFLTSHLQSICRWLLMYGNRVEVEKPEKAKELMSDLAEELSLHYLGKNVEV